mgnify:FL=1
MFGEYKIMSSSLGAGTTKNNEFSDMAWYFYDNGIIKTEIINKLDLDNFYEWEAKDDIQYCIKCNTAFDYTEYREKRFQKLVCDAHLITDIKKVNETTLIGELSMDLQKEYWSKIVDITAQELSNAGVIKIE